MTTQKGKSAAVAITALGDDDIDTYANAQDNRSRSPARSSMEPVQVQRKPKEAQKKTGPYQNPVTHQHPIQQQQHATMTADVEALKSVVLQQ